MNCKNCLNLGCRDRERTITTGEVIFGDKFGIKKTEKGLKIVCRDYKPDALTEDMLSEIPKGDEIDIF
jgi:hypothetical protein